MTSDKVKEILNNQDLNGLIDEVDKLPKEAQLTVARTIQGFLLAADHYTNKNKASA